MDRSTIVHENFLRRVADGDLPSGKAPSGILTNEQAIEIYEAQILSRALDLQSRNMQKAGTGFYTIGSSGHEGMAAVAQALRPTDPAFLHYRDGAFQTARARQVSHGDIARDMLLSFACSSDDPISGGRHKVLGSPGLMIPPQTSTIASHLPKAVGAAYSIALSRRNEPEHRLFEKDAIAVCSFGDASLNHSTAQGAINTAGWTSYQSSPLPLLFVCEDNGIGISVKTPPGWVEASVSERPGIKYFKADGLDIYHTFEVAREAADYVRKNRRPAFLHLRMVRLYGHAGADVVASYLGKDEIEAGEANDPLLHTVRLLDSAGAMDRNQALALYRNTLRNVGEIAKEAGTWPHLKSADEVMASIVPPKRVSKPTNGPSVEHRNEILGSETKALETPQPLAKCINLALTDLMLEHSGIVMMGQDIGRKGGVYGVSQKLQSRFGTSRVIDTLLDEQSILGFAIGLGQNGFVPVPEIQFLAYFHNAEDQIRGEAATLPFFSNGQFTNPMVLRIAGLGYQKGFGGHFHNDNSLAVLRDIPGIVVACPSIGSDAARMLRECIRLAREEQRVVVFIEPIALYQTRDLHEERDGGWLSDYPDPGERIALGEVGVHGDGSHVAIITYGNGHYLSRQAQEILNKNHGIESRVIDIRWIAPLPEQAILNAIADVGSVLIVDECRKTGGQAEALMAFLTENGAANFSRLTADDSFIATGPSYAATLPGRDGIVDAVRKLVAQSD